ncbi:quinone oxidoreductase family protein [Microbulbifer pacificus]|uniref:NADPH:quinone reductase n=1 Tax=Microbulbifer pacificus TaxID=407164 RepID=A0AAU0N2L6_9GAMM|nr:quinone oxidoreductase [Microbulbifer pacificus]WOX07015.1 quinone oxidoreductase [Microbulbifer pacificus]
MTQAIRFFTAGGPDVLRLEELELPELAAGEVRVRQYAIGVNFADTYYRRGIFPATLPACPGSEAAGVVEAVGPGVTAFVPGDRVAYGASEPGSYVSERNLPASVLTKLPDAIDFEAAAGMMSAGLTAGYLLRKMWPLQAGDTILFTAAAGGVGQIAVQWAKALGLTVIGTVGSKDKIAIALAAGCDHVIDHSTEDLAARVRDITDGQGVSVAYDSVGKLTFAGSLKSVKTRGLLVSFGTASGAPPDLNLMELVLNGSLYVTRPGVAHYVADPAEREELSRELLDHVESGRIRIAVNHRYELADAAKAHEDLESRRTSGSLVLLP